MNLVEENVYVILPGIFGALRKVGAISPSRALFSPYAIVCKLPPTEKLVLAKIAPPRNAEFPVRVRP